MAVCKDLQRFKIDSGQRIGREMVAQKVAGNLDPTEGLAKIAVVWRSDLTHADKNTATSFA